MWRQSGRSGRVGEGEGSVLGGGMEEVKWGGGGCELGDTNDDDEDDTDDEPCSCV